MSKQQVSGSKHDPIKLYDYDKIITRTFALIQKDLSENNFRIIKKFDRVLVNESLSDGRRSKILSTLLSLSRLVNKNWDVQMLLLKINKTEIQLDNFLQNQ